VLEEEPLLAKANLKRATRLLIARTLAQGFGQHIEKSTAHQNAEIQCCLLRWNLLVQALIEIEMLGGIQQSAIAL